MSALKTWYELKAEGERLRVDFLRTDLDLCMTFADLVATEIAMRDRPAAERVCMKGERGYATIARFLPAIQDVECQMEIAQKLASLRTALDAARDLLQTEDRFTMTNREPGDA